MRRLIPLLLVAVLAFAAGAAGANGSLTRLLADAGIHLGATPTVTATTVAASSAGPSATASLVAPSATNTSGPPATQSSVPASATPAATSTSGPSPTPSASPSPSPVPAPAGPVSLDQQTAAGARLPAGGWSGVAGLTLRVQAPAAGGDRRVEIEVRPAGQPFSGTPMYAAPVIGGVADVPVRGLAAGHYHWQARLTSAAGSSSWTPFTMQGAAFGVQLSPPAAPVASSPTNPRSDVTYASHVTTFTWSAPADPSGIAGYSYRLDRNPLNQAPPVLRTAARTVSYNGLATGAYFFHVRAVDGVGNWGPVTTYPIRIDVTPPAVTNTHVSGYNINPLLQTLELDYTLTKVAHVKIGIYNEAGIRIRHIVPSEPMPAGVPLKVLWDGKDNAGKPVPPGVYYVYLRATDSLSNTNLIPWGGFRVTQKRIVVSLTQQRLWAYDGDTLLLTTLVTTGNKALPTPTGVFYIQFARHPFTFISMWPKGSLYYYPPSKVQYALYFKDYGYYIHDAPWRTYFGPGSNASLGKPGTDYTGTHGCINVPPGPMATLYKWAIPGTAVQVVP